MSGACDLGLGHTAERQQRAGRASHIEPACVDLRGRARRATSCASHVELVYVDLRGGARRATNRTDHVEVVHALDRRAPARRATSCASQAFVRGAPCDVREVLP